MKWVAVNQSKPLLPINQDLSGLNLLNQVSVSKAMQEWEAEASRVQTFKGKEVCSKMEALKELGLWEKQIKMENKEITTTE